MIILIYQDISNELKNHKWEQKRFNGKLKIHEQLINLKSEVKMLQKEVFRYDKKK